MKRNIPGVEGSVYPPPGLLSVLVSSFSSLKFKVIMEIEF